MIASEVLKSLGRRLGRTRYSEGSLQKVGKRHKQWLGYWYVYVPVAGCEVRRKRKKIIGPATMPKHEAREALRQLIAVSRGQAPVVPEAPTFQYAWERFVTLKAAAWSRHTAATIVCVFKTSVLPLVGNMDLGAVKVDHLQDAVNQMAESGRSRSSIQTVRTYLKAMYEYAIDVDLCAKNPARAGNLVTPKRGVGKPCERFLSLDEIRALLQKAEGREHLILRLFLVGGFRPAELFALRVNDVEPGQIRVDEAIKDHEQGDDRLGDPKTKGSRGYVASTEGLDEEITEWVRELGVIGPDAWLFPSERGTPIRPGNYLKRVLKPLAVEAGVGVKDTGKRDEEGKPILTSDITYQALRRTCATYFRQDLKSAQAQLRHTTPMTTAKHYQKAISSDHRAAVEALDAEFLERTLI